MGNVKCCMLRAQDDWRLDRIPSSAFMSTPEADLYEEAKESQGWNSGCYSSNLQRHEKDIVKVFHKSGRLGLTLTSDFRGMDAYVTTIDLEKNKMLEDTGLVLNSKVLQVNDQSVESKPLPEISKSIIACRNPYTITFCKPCGLMETEKPDVAPAKELKELQKYMSC